MNNCESGLSQHQDTITNYMYLGLLPFFVGALGPWIFASHEAAFVEFFILYSSVILAFLSGCIWLLGLFVIKEANVRHIHCAIIFSLFPVAAFFLPSTLTLGLLILGFLGLLFWEKLFINEHYPSWYQQLRHRISFIAVACHMLAIWNVIHQ